MDHEAKKRLEKLKQLAMDDSEMLDYLKASLGEESIGIKPILVLYGSETGTA